MITQQPGRILSRLYRGQGLQVEVVKTHVVAFSNSTLFGKIYTFLHC